jgi:hypothetical protein
MLISGVTLGVRVKGSGVLVIRKILGVGVTIPGVRVGMGVQAGKGCGLTFQVMQEESRNAIANNARTFFILIPSPALFYPTLEEEEEGKIR